MKKIFNFLNSKMTKLVFTAVVLILFVLSLISLIKGWNSSISVTDLLESSFGSLYFEESGEEAFSTIVHYSDVPIYLCFQCTLVFGIISAISLVNLFFNKVDENYFLRLFLSLGNAISILLYNILYQGNLNYSGFAWIAIALSSLLFIYQLFAFILSSIYQQINFKVAFLNCLIAYGSWQIFYSIFLFIAHGSLLSVTNWLFYVILIPIRIFVTFLIFICAPEIGLSNSAISLTMVVLIIYFFIILVIYLVKVIKSKKKTNKNSI